MSEEEQYVRWEMATRRWSRVTVLTALLDEVNRLVQERPDLGYASASSFVNDAVRRLVERYRQKAQ